MMKRCLTCIVFAVLLSGCSIYKIDSRDTTLDFYPPKSSIEQVAYLDKVEKPHEIIGIVTATTDRTQPIQEVIDKMRQEAAVLGGDAIVDMRSNMTNIVSDHASKQPFPGESILVHYSAKVIVFK